MLMTEFMLILKYGMNINEKKGRTWSMQNNLSVHKRLINGLCHI